jgi:hypothetical protein
MKNKGRTNKLLLTVLVLQTIGGLFLAWFLYNFITDPDSALNRSIAAKVQAVAGSFKPLQGPKGDIGKTGPQGPAGQNGANGDNGRNGATGKTGPQGEPGPIGPQGEQGLKGDKGDKGDTGEQGPKAEFRCNPETARDEYRYPGDEDWQETGGACIPVEGGE